MTATNGDFRGLAAEINVTPMIDVLLVLLIIFMVIVPATPRGEAALIPQPKPQGIAESGPVVLQMLKGSGDSIKFRINQQTVAQGELKARLSSIYANRAERVLFLKGDDQLSFTQVASVIDIGHAAGADRIGIMTPKVLAGR